jgi:DNA ligase-associated metallophosphoesterase
MMAVPLPFAGIELWAMQQGALWWLDESTLLVADLHLEKGSSLARRGALLPPYDSAATLTALGQLIDALQPRRVVCLGDSFHDPDGPARLCADSATGLQRLARGREWWWIVGNHDGDAAGFTRLPGDVAAEATLGPLVLRHQATANATSGEVSGHFHPKARVAVTGRSIVGRCFVGDHRRLILPAFGAYAGGLDVFHPAIAALLSPAFSVWLLGRSRVHCLASHRLHRPARAGPALP